MTALLMEQDHFEMGLSPVADFAGADPTYTDVVNMKLHDTVRFIVNWGVGATGTVKYTVEACDDVVPTNVTAVPFWYRITVAGGTPGVVTRTDAATGVTPAAGSDQILEIEVKAADVGMTGYGYVRLKHDEVVNSPILGGVLIQMGKPRYSGKQHATSVV